MKPPFLYGTLADGDTFINRVEERQQLKTFLRQGINVMLVSPRRWGKSSLVKRVGDELQAEDDTLRIVFIDAFGIHSEREFYDTLATAVIRATASTLERQVQNAKQFLQSLAPTITFKDSLALQIRLNAPAPEALDVLNLPERVAKEKGLRLVICIDEFQQLALLRAYPTLEGKMRSAWQQHHHVCYCLYGSKRHMMLDIFNNAHKPFYRFGQLLFLKKIDQREWVEYIVGGFARTGKHITPDLAARIAATVDCHSWYVQQLAFFVWTATDEEATSDIVESQTQLLIDTNAPMYQNELDALTAPQKAMLRAIADGITQLNAVATVAAYELGTPQTITRNKRILQERDIIEMGDGRLVFTDPVFALWFKAM